MEETIASSPSNRLGSDLIKQSKLRPKLGKSYAASGCRYEYSRMGISYLGQRNLHSPQQMCSIRKTTRIVCIRLIPWDEMYLEKYEEFIRAFGQRYNGNHHIYSIQMNGGGHIGEMNLPKAYDKWKHVGYSDEKLIAVWKRLIDAYQKAFPNTPTNLDINEPLGSHSDVLDSVVSYVLATYPRKVYLQQNGLRANFPRENRIRQILREASRKTTVGYQMVGGKGWLDQHIGDRLTAFQNALEDHASYIEIYYSDVRDPGHRATLQLLLTESGKK